MKIKHFFVGAGLSLALALGVGAASGFNIHKTVEVNASGEKSCTFITSEPTWGGVGSRGLHAWGEGNETLLCGEWDDNQLGKMTLSDGYYRQTVNFTTSCDGIIFRFKQNSDYWQSVNLTIPGGFLNGNTYQIYDVSWNADKQGYKLANASVSLYSGEASHTFGLIGSADDYTNDFATFEEQQDGSFVVEAHMNANDTFKIRADESWSHSWGLSAFTAAGHYLEVSGENIKVLASGTYTITLPDGFFLSGSGATYTVNQDVADGAYLRGDWTNGWTMGGQLAMNGSGSPFTITGVNLSAGSAVKMVYIEYGQEAWWGEFDSVESTDPTSYPVQEIDDGHEHTNAGVVSTGTYNITVTYVNDGKWKYTFEGTANEDLDDACEYARGFLSAMQSNCPYTAQDGSVSKVISTWSAQKTAFAALDEKVKSYLTNKNSNVKDITDLFSSYDWIYLNYAGVRELTGADFLGRNPVVINPNNPASVINNTNNAGVVIAVITITSIVLVGGIFVIRRRKEQE